MSQKAKRERSARAARRSSGVDPSRLTSFPHELSGGMRQRVMIAMALALDPQVMIMDEPTTALDVVVQRGILREIMRLRERLGFAVIFITHDLPLLLEISDRIAVMRGGEIVELGTAAEIYRTPAARVHEAAARELPEPDAATRGDVRPHGRERQPRRRHHDRGVPIGDDLEARNLVKDFRLRGGLTVSHAPRGEGRLVHARAGQDDRAGRRERQRASRRSRG